VEGKQFVWVWQERIEPKKTRVPNPDVIAVRVADDLDQGVLTNAWRGRASRRLMSALK